MILRFGDKYIKILLYRS